MQHPRHPAVPSFPCRIASLASLRWHCRASLSVLCVFSDSRNPTKPSDSKGQSLPCHAVLIYMSAHMLCRAVLKNISLNIIFLVDSILANGYVLGITSNDKGSNTMKMFSSACCTRAGWRLFHVETPADDLLVSVAPDADLDGMVSGFCHDEQEMVRITGWNCTFRPLCPDTGVYLDTASGEYFDL